MLLLHCDTVRLERILYKSAHLPLLSSDGTLPFSSHFILGGYVKA